MPPGDKLLAEWFWIDRYDGSSAALLNMECQGVYRSMLSQAWRRGARLPNDHEAIRRAIRCTPKEWSRCWPKIQGYWRLDETGHLVNDTQLEVYAEALRLQQAASQKGQAGASARWGKHSSGNAQASAQAEPEQWPPSPSLSPDEVLKDHRTSSTRGKVFVGSRLVVSQKQHACVVDALGADAAYVDWMALYPEWDAELVASGEAFDTLAFLRKKATERVKALRRGGALFAAQPQEDPRRAERERRQAEDEALSVMVDDIWRRKSEFERGHWRKLAEPEIAPYAARMTEESRTKALDAAARRLLRDQLRTRDAIEQELNRLIAGVA